MVDIIITTAAVGTVVLLMIDVAITTIIFIAAFIITLV